MAFNNNVFLRICSRYVFLLLTLCLLYVPSYEVSGQDVGIDSTIIYPDTIFSDLTIEYIEGGNFNYYNKRGQTVGGGRKQSDGSYNVYHMGRVYQKGYLSGTEPKKIVSKTLKSDTASVSNEKIVVLQTPQIIIHERNNYSSPSSSVVRYSGGEAIRSNIDKTTYDSNGRPYYRWNSEEMSTSHIKDPVIRAEVRYQQVKEDARRRAEDRKR